jgi:hypothetical protein
MEVHAALSPLAAQIDSALNSDLERPWCVHRLYELDPAAPTATDRDSGLTLVQRAADELVAAGRAKREYVSATGIGVHCEDALYWSPRAHRAALAEFGPEYESPTVLHRLASHFRCRGL